MKYFQKTAASKEERQRTKDLKNLAAGTAAGITTAGVVHPLDTYLTSLQTKSTAKALKFKKELAALPFSGKVKRLYHGVGLKAAKVGIASGLSFALYEKFKNQLK